MINFDFFSRDRGSKTYDVRANAGDFIIGEVGRIDINSGQTLEVIMPEIFFNSNNFEQ